MLTKQNNKYQKYLSNLKKYRYLSKNSLSIGLPKLGSYFYNIQKKRYDLIFSSEGVGKSSFVLNSYIMHPYLDSLNKDVDLKILYYSMEVDYDEILSKLLAWYIFHTKGKVTSSSQIQGKTKDVLSEDVESLIQSSEYELFFNDFLQKVEIIDIPKTPSQVRKELYQFAESRGKIITEENGNLRYSPNNVKEHVIVIFDTLGNLLPEVGGESDSNKKPRIDKHSSNCRSVYRNLFHYTVVNVMHSNRAISSTDRNKHGEIFPTKDDIKDSGQPSNDANLVIALFNPFDYMNDNNTLSKFMGFDIVNMSNTFRAAAVLKNRDGYSNKRTPLLYNGASSYWAELPNSNLLDINFYQRLKDDLILSMPV
jgi:hypothetical protein